MSEYTPTPRTQVRRLAKRASYDREQIHAILDDAFVCHVGFVANGQPYVIPTNFVRIDEEIYLHGSAASRMLKSLSEGMDVCVTVTLVDGLVLARSAFHHSVNYRSVVALGKARLITDPDEKRNALRAFTNHVVPGRWEEVREPTAQELKATSVLALALNEISAKIRTGPPIDDEEDYRIPVWAGVVPLAITPGTPEPDEQLVDGVTPFDVGRLAQGGARE